MSSNLSDQCWRDDQRTMLQDNTWYAYDVRQNFPSIYFVPVDQPWGAFEMIPTVLTYIDCILVRNESEDQGTLLAHYLVQNGWKKQYFDQSGRIARIACSYYKALISKDPDCHYYQPFSRNALILRVGKLWWRDIFKAGVTQFKIIDPVMDDELS